MQTNLLLGRNEGKGEAGGVHLVERAARRQVLEDGADAFNSHCCGIEMRDGPGEGGSGSLCLARGVAEDDATVRKLATGSNIACDAGG